VSYGGNVLMYSCCLLDFRNSTEAVSRLTSQTT